MNKERDGMKTAKELLSELEDEKHIPILHDTELLSRLSEMLRENPTGPGFFTDHSELRLIMYFLFDRERMPEEMRDFHGLAFQFPFEGGPVFAIGISSEALDKGEEYVNRLWLHEVAHVLHHDDVTLHDDRFHALYAVLLDQYNQANGTDLKPV